MENYQLTPIRNFLDALKIRKIRNECREYMTNNTSEIDVRKQISWYFNIYRKENNKNKMTCFLFRVKKKNAGFALIRMELKKYWITGGLTHEYRGKGLGKVLFANLLKEIPSDEVWLEVLNTNEAAKKIYKELGFRKISEKDINDKKVSVMKLVIGLKIKNGKI